MATGTPSGYGYYDEGSQGSSLPLPSTALQYQSEFPQEQQRQQTFPQYGAGLMYGIPQQVPPNQPYNTVQPYQQPRRSAAIEVLSTQFAGVPPFYVPGEPTSASAATVPSQPAPSQFPSHTYAQQPTGARSSLAPVYAPAMSDVPQMGASQPVPTQDYGQSAPNYDVAYGQYQNALKRTFQNIRNGQLAEAGQTLLEISEWLLTHAAELGLIRDDQSLHGEHLKLWTEFNLCWLSALQTQKETAQAMLRTGQRPAPPQSLIPTTFLENMGRDLVRLCDGMERHGLVDYEMGVWEEEIISLLEDCLNLLEDSGGDGHGSQAGHRTGQSGTSQESVPIGIRNA